MVVKIAGKQEAQHRPLVLGDVQSAARTRGKVVYFAHAKAHTKTGPYSRDILFL